MNLHYLQHVPFEDLGYIQIWAEEHKHTVTCTRLFAGENLPLLDAFDWLVIMGGPMNIYAYDTYPWLRKERDFIKATIKAKKRVLGICLGAQLIADVLGARVVKNEQKEIGWFPVCLAPESSTTEISSILPEKFMAFHWHGDRFDIPEKAIRLMESEGCKNQAFLYARTVLALQCHLETRKCNAEELIMHCSDELTEGRYIQTPENMVVSDDYFEQSNMLMKRILDWF